MTAHPEQDYAAATFERALVSARCARLSTTAAEGTGEPLAMMLRPGNAGPNTAADHITVIRDALRRLPLAATGGRIGRKY